MTRGVRLYLVGSIVLVSLAGCGRGFFQAEREPWRAEAEIACLKSGAVKESLDVVRIDPISGPGACGADYPLKVSAFGEGVPAHGFADEDLRPPAPIGNQPRWPINQPPSYPPQGSYPQGSEQPPRLGPGNGNPVAAVGPVAVKPAAMLACPIVSVLDHWLADSVQPAAMRWFGAPVVEIKHISAYSCRGMNGNPHAHISEHAFGNALDIAAFTLADGRRITVRDGWRGLPEEQGFLRDVQAAACQRFSTVLAPGSNVYHYDHIHVDLMRRASGNIICEPDAVSGEEIASRAAHRNPYASRRPFVTGSLGGQRQAPRKRAREKVDEEDEFEDD